MHPSQLKGLNQIPTLTPSLLILSELYGQVVGTEKKNEKGRTLLEELTGLPPLWGSPGFLPLELRSFVWESVLWARWAWIGGQSYVSWERARVEWASLSSGPVPGDHLPSEPLFKTAGRKEGRRNRGKDPAAALQPPDGSIKSHLPPKRGECPWWE